MMDLAGPGAAWAVLAALLLVSSVGVVSILKMILILILTLLGCVITFFLTLFVTTKVSWVDNLSKTKYGHIQKLPFSTDLTPYELMVLAV